MMAGLRLFVPLNVMQCGCHLCLLVVLRKPLLSPRSGPCPLILPPPHTTTHPLPSLPFFLLSFTLQQQPKAVPWTQQQALPTYTMYGAMGGGGGGASAGGEGGREGGREGGKGDDDWGGGGGGEREASPLLVYD
jgi:hypothetical protein